MKTTFAALVAVAAFAAPAFAQDLPPAVKARKGQFEIMALNLGVLAGMARGTIEYDAAAAQAAGDSIVAVTTLDQSNLWPTGTDSGSVPGSRAKPNIWDNMDDVMAKWTALGEAATTMAAAVGTGKEALGPQLGALSKACSACHDEYRVSE